MADAALNAISRLHLKSGPCHLSSRYLGIMLPCNYNITSKFGDGMTSVMAHCVPLLYDAW